jgi:hypothetical protein
VSGKGVLAATTAVVGLVVAPALADELGTAGDVHYQSFPVALTAGEGTLITQLCGPGEKATGGGFGTVSFNILPAEIGPFDGGDGDGTPDDIVAVRGGADGIDTVTAYAMCADVSGQYVVKSKSSAANEADSVKAKCPTDRHLIGGGASAGAKQLKSTFPWDSKDAGNQPDDGWKASAHGGPPTVISAIALCAEDMPSYDKASTTLDPSDTTAVVPTCEGGSHVSAIGAQLTGPPEFADLRSMRPRDSDDGNTVPDDDALVNMANSAMAEDPQTFTGWVVCLG